MSIKKGLAPVLFEDTKILIIGTAPGEDSLDKQEYYAHENNKFWGTIMAILDETDPVDYKNRINILRKHRIGLWDLYETFERTNENSSDKQTVVKTWNDFGKYIPLDVSIIFNGKWGDSKYKHVRKFIKNNIPQRAYHCYSTTPMPIGVSNENRFKDWENTINSLK